MIEPLFGSASPIWSTAASPGFALQMPLQNPIGFGSPLGGGSGLGPSALLGGAGTISSGARDVALGLIPAQGYVATGAMMPGTAAPNLAPAFQFAAGPPPALLNPDPMTGVSAPALLGAVALRRGQPQGPTNDQEVEDFIYDALEFLSGAADVEVRCEGGRATLTGSVHHKRIKRDVGEIAWAIPALQDVQNNVTVTSRRRARSTSREAEAQPAAQPRK